LFGFFSFLSPAETANPVYGVSAKPALFKMFNLRTTPPRALLRLRAPSTAFRKQPHLLLGIHLPSYGHAERRHTSTSSAAYHIAPSPPSQPPPKSWIERTPEKIRPYLYLARVDKPIGTLLLYYPCSASLFPEIGIRNRDG